MSSKRRIKVGHSWQLAAGHYEASKIALEIIGPSVTDMSAWSRYGRAYPALRWRVPVSVLGGSWPFLYELTTAPSGMTLGQRYGQTDYGILEWSNPTTGDHTVAVKVTDHEGTEVTATWTLSVATTKTIFVDAAAAGGGDGTISSPFNSIEAFWGTNKYGAAFNDYHVYFKDGTYITETDWDTDAVTTGALTWLTGKPKVLLAYPGHSPVIDTTLAGFFMADAGWSGTHHDYFFHGLSFIGAGAATYYQQATLRLFSSDRSVFFENFFGSQSNTGLEGQNPCHIFADGGLKTKLSIIGNTFTDLDYFMCGELYEYHKIVIEGNVCNSGDNLSRLFYLKVGNENASIRNNSASVPAGLSNGIDIGAEQEPQNGTIEICWNNIAIVGSPITIAGQAVALTGPVWDYRNTLQGSFNKLSGLSSGDWYATRNVVVHNGTYSATDGYGKLSGGVTITSSEVQDETSAAGFLNADGTIAAAYLTTNGLTRGTRGHEVY